MTDTEKLDRARDVIDSILHNTKDHNGLSMERLNFELNVVRAILQNLLNTLRS
jgi:hypothetical protein